MKSFFFYYAQNEDNNLALLFHTNTARIKAVLMMRLHRLLDALPKEICHQGSPSI